METILSERAHELFLALTVACRRIEGHAMLTDPLLVAAGRLGVLTREAVRKGGTPAVIELLGEAERAYREVTYWFEALDHGRYFAEADSNRIGTLCRRFGPRLTRTLAEQRQGQNEDGRQFRRPRCFRTASRLCLRRFMREDAARVCLLADDPDVRESGFPVITSEDEAIAQMASWQWDTAWMAAAHSGDGTVVGYVSLLRLPHSDTARRLSIGLLSDWRGIGYGDEILTARLDYAFFAEYHLEAVTAHCLSEAETYRRILERNGFRLDARLPYEGKAGGELLSYSIARSDWRCERVSVGVTLLPEDEED